MTSRENKVLGRVVIITDEEECLVLEFSSDALKKQSKEPKSNDCGQINIKTSIVINL